VSPETDRTDSASSVYAGDTQTPVDAVLDELDEAEREVERRWRFAIGSICFDVALVVLIVQIAVATTQLRETWPLVVWFASMVAVCGTMSYESKKKLIDARRQVQALRGRADRLVDL